jgi:hypothetical protein
MARKRAKNTLSNINKLIAQGRGQGEGKEYIPWLDARANTNKAYTNREKGWKTERVHHFLSELELQYFLSLEWCPNIIDIREQYPLLPIERTIEIAESLGIEHPNFDGDYVVMTTDFLITIETDKGITQKVRTIKPEDDLDIRQLEKFDIERQFFLEQGITDWAIVTNQDFNFNFIRNMEWLYDARTIEYRDNVDYETVEKVSKLLFKEISAETEGLSKIALKMDERLGLEEGTSLFIVRYMLANKFWVTDIVNQKINPSNKLHISKGKNIENKLRSASSG